MLNGMRTLKSSPPNFAAFLAVMFLACTSQAVWADTLERVVLVSRHGVRPPTRGNEELNKYSEQAWPEWPVAPGELTPHGATALERMGDGLKQRYGTLLGNCNFFIWSDGADSRTRDSGAALARGLSPGCAARTAHGAPGKDDPIFDAIDAGLCPVDPARAQETIEQRLGTILSRDNAAYVRGRQRLQSILIPGKTCGSGETNACHIASGENQVRLTKKEARLDGPLNLGSSLSENLLLEYAQGMQGDQLAWGRLGKTEAERKQALAEVLALHNLYSDVVRRNPYLASRRSTPMMHTILDALDGKTSTFKGAAPLPSDNRVLVFLGHDGNLASLSGLLDSAWSLPGQPDATAPDTVLAFERWRTGDGKSRVTVRVYYQTLDQLQQLTRFDAHHPVPSLALKVPGCDGQSCTPEKFRAHLMPKLSGDCITPGP